MTSLLLVPLGMVVGFGAGLLGIGGGAIMVPALTAYFLWLQLDASVVVHMALATSLSCIVFNACLSIWTHQKHHAILWPITIKITPAVLLGSAIATWFVVQIPAKTIAMIFMLLMLAVAIQLLVGAQPNPQTNRTLKLTSLLPAGFLIGFLSAMIAIGGGSLTVPYLTFYQISINRAIATAASIGLPLALAGCAVFAFGVSEPNQLPDETWGFIYWPATLALSLGSLMTTHLGAHLTHRLPVNTLKKIFAFLVMILAVQMYLQFH